VKGLIRAVSGAEADDGHEAAGSGAFLAVAEEEIAAAGGAEAANEDVLGAEAGIQELRAVGFAEVEANVCGRGLVAWGHHVEPLQGVRLVAGAKLVKPSRGVGELGRKGRGDFGADFVATTANCGPESREEIGGLGAIFHLHAADSLPGDARKGAAPAGVDGGNDAFLGVDKENGNAVGGLDAEEEAGACRGRGVAAAGFGRSGVEKMDDV